MMNDAREQRKERIAEQVKFCELMMNRIGKDVEKRNEGYFRMDGYCPIQNYIVHLRRELLHLSRMIEGIENE